MRFLFAFQNYIHLYWNEILWEVINFFPCLSKQSKQLFVRLNYNETKTTVAHTLSLLTVHSIIHSLTHIHRAHEDLLRPVFQLLLWNNLFVQLENDKYSIWFSSRKGIDERTVPSPGKPPKRSKLFCFGSFWLIKLHNSMVPFYKNKMRSTGF